MTLILGLLPKTSSRLLCRSLCWLHNTSKQTDKQAWVCHDKDVRMWQTQCQDRHRHDKKGSKHSQHFLLTSCLLHVVQTGKRRLSSEWNATMKTALLERCGRVNTVHLIPSTRYGLAHSPTEALAQSPTREQQAMQSAQKQPAPKKIGWGRYVCALFN